MHWRYCSLALAQRISSNGLVQGCSISIANALEILQSCTKSTICESDEYIVLLGYVKRAQTAGIKVTDNSRRSTDRFTWEAPTPPGIAPVWGLGQRMKKSCHGNLFRIAGPFWGKSHWIPITQGQKDGSVKFALLLVWKYCCTNDQDAGDLRYRDAGVTLF